MFVVSIETDNDAFTGDVVAELTACLGRVTQRIQRDGLRQAVEAGMVLDTNGNRVGTWRYTR